MFAISLQIVFSFFNKNTGDVDIYSLKCDWQWEWIQMKSKLWRVYPEETTIKARTGPELPAKKADKNMKIKDSHEPNTEEHWTEPDSSI